MPDVQGVVGMRPQFLDVTGLLDRGRGPFTIDVSSSDTDVVTVKDVGDGRVRLTYNAVGTSVVTLTVYDRNDQQAGDTFQVIVGGQLGTTESPSDISGEVGGEDQTINVARYFEGGLLPYEYSVTSSDDSVVQVDVDGDGNVTHSFVGAGTAIVTVEITDRQPVSVSISYGVRVFQPLQLTGSFEDIAVDEGSDNVSASAGSILSGGVAPLNYSILSSDPSVVSVTVDSDGLIQHVFEGPGSAVVNLRVTDVTGNSVETSYDVTVRSVLVDEGILRDIETSLNAPSLVLDAASAISGGRQPYTYAITSSDPSVVSAVVSKEGSITLSNEGEGESDVFLSITDATGVSLELTFQVLVNPALVAVGSLSDLVLVSLDPAQLVETAGLVSGGTAPYTSQAVSSNPLVVDATVTSTGSISTDSKGLGTAAVSYSVTDAAGAQVTLVYTVQVVPPLTAGINPADIVVSEGAPTMTRDASEAVTGGLQPYSFDVSSSDANVVTVSVDATGTEVHEFANAGRAIVRLSITDAIGNVFETSYTVLVRAPVTFSGDPANVIVNDGHPDLAKHVDNLVSGGTAPFVYEATSSNPDVVTVTTNSEGEVIHVFTGAGQTEVSVRVTDAIGDVITTSYSVTVNPVLAIGTAPADIAVNAGSMPLRLDASAMVAGGTSPYTYQVVSSNPAAVQIDQQGDQLVHTFISEGASVVTIRVTDATGEVVETSYEITVNSALKVVSIPSEVSVTSGADSELLALQGVFSGGTLPYSYQVTSNNTSVVTVELLDSREIEHVFGNEGAAEITLVVTDATGHSLQVAYDVSVNGSLHAGLDLDGVTADVDDPDLEIDASGSVVGGVLPHTYTVASSDESVVKVTVDERGDIIHDFRAVGTATITLVVTDALGSTYPVSYPVVVNPQLSLGVPIKDIVADANSPRRELETHGVATGGTTPYSYRVTSSNDSMVEVSVDEDGRITHEFIQVGSSLVTLTVEDAVGHSVDIEYMVTVNPPLSIGANLGAVVVNEGVASEQVDASGAVIDGSPGYIYAVTSSNKSVVDVSVSQTGLIEQTFGGAGTAMVTLTVTDTAGESIQLTYPVTVSSPLTFTELLPDLTFESGAPGKQIDAGRVVTGGTGSYEFQVSSSNESVASAFVDRNGMIGLGIGDSGVSVITLVVSDSEGHVAVDSFLTVVNPPLHAGVPIDPIEVNIGDAAEVVDITSAIIGGSRPYTYRISSSNPLAVAVTVSESGLVEHSFRNVGSARIRLTATDAAGNSASVTYEATVNEVLSLNRALSDVTVNAGAPPLVKGTEAALSGGTAPFEFVVSATDPTVIDVAVDESGQVTHTFLSDGRSEVVVQVTDARGASVTARYDVTVNAVFALTGSVEDILVNEGAPNRIVDGSTIVSGGTEPIVYSVVASDPTVVSVSVDASGRIAHRFLSPGVTEVTLRITDALGNGLDTSYRVTVNPSLRFSSPLEDIFVNKGNENLSVDLASAVSGGTPPYAYELIVPSETILTADVSSDGLAELEFASEGSVAVTVQVTDALGSLVSTGFDVTVNGTLSAGEALPDLVVELGEAEFTVSVRDAVTGGTQPYQYAVTSNDPDVIEVDVDQDGTISHTIGNIGVATVHLQVSDALGARFERDYLVTVHPPLTIANRLDDVTVNVASGDVSTSVEGKVQGGTRPYQFLAVSSDSSIVAVDISENGILSYRFNSVGTASVEVTVVDARGQSVVSSHQVQVNPQLAVGSLEDLLVNAGAEPIARDASVVVFGGTPPFRYSVRTSNPASANAVVDENGLIEHQFGTSGEANIQLSVTDATNAEATTTYAVRVNEAFVPGDPLTDIVANAGSGTQSIDLSSVVIGGTAPYSYEVQSSDTSVLDVSIGSDGTIEQTPIGAGSASVTLTVIDALGDRVEVTYDVAVNALFRQTSTVPGVVVDLDSPDPRVGLLAYVEGGTLPYTFSVSSSDSSIVIPIMEGSGVVDHVFTGIGIADIVVTIEDATGATIDVLYPVTVDPILESIASLPSVVVNVGADAITSTVRDVVTGGTLPYQYDISSSDPAVATGAVEDGEISVEFGQPGTTTLTLVTTDAVGASRSTTLDVTVNPALAPAGVIPDVSANLSSSQSWVELASVVSGGTPPYTYEVVVADPQVAAATITSESSIRYDINGLGTTTSRVIITDSFGDQIELSNRVTVNTSLSANQKLDPVVVNEGAPDLLRNASESKRGGTQPYSFSVTSSDTSVVGVFLDADNNIVHRFRSPGLATIQLEVTDAVGEQATGTYSVTVNPSLSLADAVALTVANLGSDVGSTDLSDLVTGGTSPYEFSVVSSDPSILQPSLDADGIVTYTATGTGLVTFSVSIVDAQGERIDTEYQIQINETLTWSSVPDDVTVNLGAPSSTVDLRALQSGGTAPFIYEVSSSRPAVNQVSVDSSGLVTQRFLETGPASITVRITDATGEHIESTYQVRVNPALSIAQPDSIVVNAGAFPLDVDQSVAVSGGTSPFNFDVSSSSPDVVEVTVEPSGVVAHAFGAEGEALVSFSVSDSLGDTRTVSYQVRVNPLLEVSDSSVDTTVNEGAPRSVIDLATLITGGTSPYSISVTSSDPDVVTAQVSSESRMILFFGQAGTATVQVTFSDATGATATKEIRVTVNPPLTIARPVQDIATVLDAGSLETSLAGFISGGTEPYQFEVVSELSDVVEVSLTPEGAVLHLLKSQGQSSITLTVTDALGSRVSQAYGVSVNDSFTTGIAPEDFEVNIGAPDRILDATNTVAGGLQPYRYSVVSAHPSNVDVSLDEQGTLTHSFGEPGESKVTLTVTDGGGEVVQHVYVVTVNAGLMAGTVPGDILAHEGSDPVRVQTEFSGGTLPYTYRITSSSPSVASVEIDDRGVVDVVFGSQGEATITVEATEQYGASSTISFGVIVNPLLVVTTPLPSVYGQSMTSGGEFDLNLDLMGGSAPYHYEIVSSDSSVVQAFVDGAGIVHHEFRNFGAATITVFIEDAAGDTTSTSYEVEVSDQLVVTSPPTGITASKEFEDQILHVSDVVAGGRRPYTYSVMSSDPDVVEVVMDRDGLLTHTFGTSGSAEVEILVTDALGQEVRFTYPVTVLPALMWSGVQGDLVRNEGAEDLVTFLSDLVQGGSAPYVFSLRSSDPSVASARIDGTDQATVHFGEAGQAEIEATVTDQLGTSKSIAFFVQVQPTFTTSGTISDVVVNLGEAPEERSYASLVSGGTMPYVWTVQSSDTDVVNVSVDEEGQVGHEFKGVGEALVTLTITDSQGETALLDYHVRVNPVLTLASPAGDVHTSLGSPPLQVDLLRFAAGGTPPYSFDVDSSNPEVALPQLNSASTFSIEFLSVGTSTLTVTVTDQLGHQVVVTQTVIVDPALIVDQSPADIVANVGSPAPARTVSGVFAGGVRPFTHSVTSSDTTVVKVGLDASGSISHQFIGEGSATITLTVLDAAGGQLSSTYEITVHPPLVTGTAIRDVTVSQGTPPALRYAADAISGGTAPYTWQVVSSNPEVVRAEVDELGQILHQFGSVGQSVMTVEVQDAVGDILSLQYTVVVNSSLTAVDTPDDIRVVLGSPDQPFDIRSFVSGGTAPITFTGSVSDTSVVSLAVDASGEGVLRYIGAGTSTVTWLATDNSGEQVRFTFQVTVSAPHVSVSTLDDLAVNVSSPDMIVEASVVSSGGASPFTYTLSNTAPEVVEASINAAGRITHRFVSAGSALITIEKMDALGQVVSVSYEVLVNPALALPGPFPDQEGVVNSTLPTIDVSAGLVGGTAPYTWSIRSGNPDQVEALIDSEGIATLNLLATGEVSLNLEVRDATGQVDSTSFLVTVNAPLGFTDLIPNLVALASSPQEEIDLSAFVAGGIRPYSYSAIAQDPAVVSIDLNAEGLISHAFLSTGSSLVTIQVTDAEGTSVTEDYTVTVTNELTLSDTLPPLFLTPESDPRQIDVSSFPQGGASPYSYAVQSADTSIVQVTVSASGVITHTPRGLGEAVVTLEIKDALGERVLIRYQTAVTAPMVLVQNPHPVEGTVGAKILPKVNLSALVQGGVRPLRFTVSSADEEVMRAFSDEQGTATHVPRREGTTFMSATIIDATNQELTVSYDAIANPPLLVAGSPGSIVEHVGVSSRAIDPSVLFSGGTEPIVYSISSLDSTVVRVWIDENGMAVHEFGRTGRTAVEITATDADGVTQHIDYPVELLAVNASPVFVSRLFDTQTFGDAGVFSFQFRAEDPNGNPVTYSLDGPGSIDPITGLWTFDVTDRVGQYELRVIASDGSQSTVTSAQLVVLDVEVYEALLAGMHMVPTVPSVGAGSIRFRVVPDLQQMQVIASIRNLLGDLEGITLHQGAVGQTGNMVYEMPTGETSFDRSYEIASGGPALTAIREGRAYVIVPTSAHPSGELRGQVLPEDNRPPSTVMSIAPSVVGIVDDSTGTALSVSWLPGTDPDGNPLSYLLQLAADQQFKDVIDLYAVGSETGKEFTGRELQSVYDRLVPPQSYVEGYEPEARLYHRVIASDGSLWTAGPVGSTLLQAQISVNTEEAGLPESFALDGNYPNPFNPVTTIAFDAPAPATVDVDIFDVLGRRVMRIQGHQVEAGYNRTIRVDASSLASGVYLYRIRGRTSNQDWTAARKMTLLR